MKFALHRAPTCVLTLLSMTPAVAGCAGVQVTAAPPSACSSLVPKSLRDVVVGVELPSRTARAGDVWSALDGQTGKLDTANANGTASLEIVEACEKRDAATFKHVTRKWWQFWR